MRVFVTGATGFIGSAVVRELLAAGHQVLGLARSDGSAAQLTAAGAEVHRGTTDDLDSLRRAAAAADGVVHTAYHHDLPPLDGAQADRRALEAMGEVLAGSDRPLVFASGSSMRPGLVVTEETVIDPAAAPARFSTEQAALVFAGRGVRVSAVRLPPTVHGEGDHHGFVPTLITIARDKGVSAFPGDGTNRWAAVHRLDAARLFRLALDAAPAGAALHGVGEEGVPVREIAEVIGKQLSLPVTAIPEQDATGHFGFLGPIFSLDVPASSALTQRRMDWHPVHTALLADLGDGHYFTE